jgi:hypothetical protein
MILQRLVCGCLVVICLGVGYADGPGSQLLPERFTGTGVVPRTVVVGHGNPLPTRLFEVVIERWSTPEEFERIVSLLETPGQDGFLAAVTAVKTRAGYARDLGPSPSSRFEESSYTLDFNLAFQAQGKNSRTVLMIGRPSPDRSTLRAVELLIEPDGKGKAWLWPATDGRVLVGKDKTRLEIEHNSGERITLMIHKS